MNSSSNSSGKGIEDKFKVGEDVEPLAGEQAVSQAVSRSCRKKTLAYQLCTVFEKTCED